MSTSNAQSDRHARRTRQTIGVLTPVALAVLVGSCSGPQPLSNAIRLQDEQDYTAMLAGTDQTPAQAFLATKAKDLGISIEEARRQDEAISTKHNPFHARRDPSAVSRGAVIFKHECISCHGEHADGRGPALPVPLNSINFHKTGLRFDITIRGGSASKWFHTIQTGKEAHTKDEACNPVTITMPGFHDRLTKEQTWLAVTYLQSMDMDIPKDQRSDSKMDTPTP